MVLLIYHIGHIKWIKFIKQIVKAHRWTEDIFGNIIVFGIYGVIINPSKNNVVNSSSALMAIHNQWWLQGAPQTIFSYGNDGSSR